MANWSPWWRHQTESFSALLACCVGNSQVTGEFPTQRPVTWSFDVFFDLRLNRGLSKQSWGWWFEMPSQSFWCHSNDTQQKTMKCIYSFTEKSSCQNNKTHYASEVTNIWKWPFGFFFFILFKFIEVHEMSSKMIYFFTGILYQSNLQKGSGFCSNIQFSWMIQSSSTWWDWCILPHYSHSTVWKWQWHFECWVIVPGYITTLKLRQNGCHFAGDIFKKHIHEWKWWNLEWVDLM